MSLALMRAGHLKPELRLAQAVSGFEASLTADQKTSFRNARSKSCKSPPTTEDVMRLTAELDMKLATNGGGGQRCYGPRFTNVLHAVQRFAALGDVLVGGSQSIVACGVWVLVRMTLLASFTRRLHELLVG